MMTIFVSSTSTDLETYRRAAADACREADFAPIVMDHFGARPEDAVTTCMREVDKADLFIGVYAYRYGYIPDGCEYSITEMEYRRAESRNIPRFCFVVKENYTNKKLRQGGDDNPDAQEKFIMYLGSSIVYTEFTTPQDLKAKVSSALTQWTKREGNFERSVREDVLRKRAEIRDEIDRLEHENRNGAARRAVLLRQRPHATGRVLTENTNLLIIGLFLVLCVVGMVMVESPFVGLLLLGGIGFLMLQQLGNRGEKIRRIDHEISSIARQIEQNNQQIARLHAEQRKGFGD